MPEQIDVDTLREWLADKHPVTVLDVRAAADRAQWSIPGSIHVDAYDALRVGTAGALDALEMPRDQPIVTVCGAGRNSQVAADLLSARGFDARSLSGGMKAWSLAWNVAEVPLTDASIRVLQVRRTGKGCLSYIVTSTGDAAVLDPSLPAKVYIDLAVKHGWRIRHVLETHIHADHLSRARALANETTAQLTLPRQQRATFAFNAIADGDSISIGGATLMALRTPGHTDESTAYHLGDLAIFTGDTLFTDGVGRPDLHADPEQAKRRASSLFASLNRLRALPPAALVLPAHASEPIAFDGRPITARLANVETWLADWLVSEDAFVDRVTSRLPPTPPNFARIVELNQLGTVPSEDPIELEAGANRCAVK
jgi:glyoxylase-like metal-dependent hydrolase (beta-lactamase superfamily II)